MGTVFSTVDVLRSATNLLRARYPEQPSPLTWNIYVPEECGPLFDASAPGLSASPLRPLEGTRTLLMAPTLIASTVPELQEIAQRHPSLLRKLKAHVEDGGMVAASASGLIYPSMMGMLDGLRLDTLWVSKPLFTRMHPECDFSATEAMSFNERLYTCVAPSQQIEFTAAILKRLLDASVGESCAQLLQYQPERQRLGYQLIEDGQMHPTTDSPVYRVQQWLKAHLQQPYRLDELAVVASTSSRTLLRHFQTAVGMTPLDYLHRVRVDRAKVLLEVTQQNLHAIALACGYSDASSFSRMFSKIAGISPGVYRQRFTMRSKRVRWRAEPPESPV